MAEPTTPVGWVAILAAILLPTVVAAGSWWSGRADDLELRALRTRVAAQQETIRQLEEQVGMLEADLDTVLDLE